MTTYPIVLKSQSKQDDVLHRFELVEGSVEGNGFERISTWLKLPWIKDTTRMCFTCGAILEIPDGSLEAHLKKYQAEHGGEDIIVRTVYRHKGPRPSTRPVGVSVVADKTRVKTIKEFVQEQEASKQNPDSGV